MSASKVIKQIMVETDTSVKDLATRLYYSNRLDSSGKMSVNEHKPAAVNPER